MRLRTLILKELIERPTPMLTCLLAILLGVTALVAVRTVTIHSEGVVARELDSLGANVLVLPKGVTLQDYYASDLHGEVLPEEYVTRLAMSNLEGVDNLSPKLCVAVGMGGRTVTLTGILPRSEFQAKAAWQGAGIFSRPIGCGAHADIPGQETPIDPRTLVRKRVIETLGDTEALIGADVAARLALHEGDKVDLLGERFTVLAILPSTGTVDDSRVFAHLHAVQRLAGRGEVVNVIEIVGCCKQIAQGLVEKLNELLPEAKVVTIKQVVQTQQNVNRLMTNLSLIFLGILLIAGGASIATAMYGNVAERRREIGTLMALGANPGLILRLFLGKAAILGLIGVSAASWQGAGPPAGLGRIWRMFLPGPCRYWPSWQPVLPSRFPCWERCSRRGGRHAWTPVLVFGRCESCCNSRQSVRTTGRTGHRSSPCGPRRLTSAAVNMWRSSARVAVGRVRSCRSSAGC
jgi:putative ABC transport system permease protein